LDSPYAFLAGGNLAHNVNVLLRLKQHAQAGSYDVMVINEQ
jgi:hypothetical protein